MFLHVDRRSSGPNFERSARCWNERSELPHRCSARKTTSRKGATPRSSAPIFENADSITALKELSAKFKGAKRKLDILDQKARLQAAQAYALGATHVLFNPVTTGRCFARWLTPARQ